MSIGSLRGWNAQTLILNGLFAAIAIAAIIQWCLAGQRGEKTCAGLQLSLKTLENRLRVERGETQGALSAIQKDQQVMQSVLLERLGRMTATAAALESGAGPPERDPIEPDAEAHALATADPAPIALPPLPEGFSDAIGFLRKFNLEDFLNDARLNPLGKQLSPIERSRARHIGIAARTEITRLENDFGLAMAEGTEVLRNEGDFLDYAPGEPYTRAPGTLTCGEPLAGGLTRIFYLDRNRFPALYALREKRGQVAREAVQRLVAMVSE